MEEVEKLGSYPIEGG